MPHTSLIIADWFSMSVARSKMPVISTTPIAPIALPSLSLIGVTVTGTPLYAPLEGVIFIVRFVAIASMRCDFEERMKKNNSFEETFLSMVQETSEEIPCVIDELVKKGLTDPAKIGVCGISMGGYITYGSVLFEKRIKAIAPVLGSPKWKSSINSSPKNHPEKFYPVALLAQNAGQDSCVPPEFARDFHKLLIPYYKESPERIAYIEYPQSNHFMIEEEWNELWENVLNWFEKFIN